MADADQNMNNMQTQEATTILDELQKDGKIRPDQ